jgi:hypothetical protein
MPLTFWKGDGFARPSGVLEIAALVWREVPGV